MFIISKNYTKKRYKCHGIYILFLTVLGTMRKLNVIWGSYKNNVVSVQFETQLNSTFQTSTEWILTIQVIWNVRLCSGVDGFQSFKGPQYFYILHKPYLQGRHSPRRVLRPLRSFKTLGSVKHCYTAQQPRKPVFSQLNSWVLFWLSLQNTSELIQYFRRCTCQHMDTTSLQGILDALDNRVHENICVKKQRSVETEGAMYFTLPAMEWPAYPAGNWRCNSHRARWI